MGHVRTPAIVSPLKVKDAPPLNPVSRAAAIEEPLTATINEITSGASAPSDNGRKELVEPPVKYLQKGGVVRIGDIYDVDSFGSSVVARRVQVVSLTPDANRASLLLIRKFPGAGERSLFRPVVQVATIAHHPHWHLVERAAPITDSGRNEATGSSGFHVLDPRIGDIYEKLSDDGSPVSLVEVESLTPVSVFLKEIHREEGSSARFNSCIGRHSFRSNRYRMVSAGGGEAVPPISASAERARHATAVITPQEPRIEVREVVLPDPRVERAVNQLESLTTEVRKLKTNAVAHLKAAAELDQAVQRIASILGEPLKK